MTLSKTNVTMVNGSSYNFTLPPPREVALMAYSGNIFLYEIIVRVGITGFLATYGMVTNVANVIVFFRQGILTDSCNASLMFLAVSDFLCCLLTFFASVFTLILNVADTSNYKWDVFGFCLGAALRPKRMFTQTTVWITAYVAFERCFSVVFPFKAKSIFNTKRSFVINCFIFVTLIGLCFPQYSEHLPMWRNVPGRNYSKLVYVYNDKVSGPVYKAFEILNAFALRITGIVVIFICNFAIIWKVNVSKKFKLIATATHKQDQDSNKQSASGQEKDQVADSSKKGTTDNTTKQAQKETKLMRMVTILCSVTLVCYSPDMFVLIVNQLIHRIPLDTYLLLFGPLEALETFNSSINIHIYYTMSSRYKNEFRKWLCNKTKGTSHAKQ